MNEMQCKGCEKPNNLFLIDGLCPKCKELNIKPKRKKGVIGRPKGSKLSRAQTEESLKLQDLARTIMADLELSNNGLCNRLGLTSDSFYRWIQGRMVVHYQKRFNGIISKAFRTLGYEC